MQEQTKLDALARVLRDIAESEHDDPKLERAIGNDEAYEEWGRGVGALHLLGELTPFGGQIVEVCFKFSGTYRPHPAMDPMPGVPVHYLLNGGPNGSYRHLQDKQPTRAFWRRLDRVIETLNRVKGSRHRFYLRQLNKSQLGFRGVETAARSVVGLTMPDSRCQAEHATPTAKGGVIRLSRDPK